jgi:hypothetical protein
MPKADRQDITEAGVVHQSLDPLLAALGWPIDDPARYKYELRTYGGRPDMILIPERGVQLSSLEAQLQNPLPAMSSRNLKGTPTLDDAIPKGRGRNQAPLGLMDVEALVRTRPAALLTELVVQSAYVVLQVVLEKSRRLFAPLAPGCLPVSQQQVVPVLDLSAQGVSHGKPQNPFAAIARRRAARDSEFQRPELPEARGKPGATTTRKPLT